jgi:light-independent protochlorophyllide reductase subunit B
LIVLTPTCTSSILQEDLENFVQRAQLDAKGDVMLADVNHYRVNELQAADRTLQQIVQFYIAKARKQGNLPEGKTEKPSVNIIGISSLGFHNHHDCTELKRLMADLGIEVNEVIPEGASVHNLKNLPRAWFNLVPYREIGLMAASFLEEDFGMPYVDITPMGVVETARCIRKIQEVLNAQGADVDYEEYINEQTLYVSQAAWFSRSIDCQNLTG